MTFKLILKFSYSNPIYKINKINTGYFVYILAYKMPSLTSSSISIGYKYCK